MEATTKRAIINYVLSNTKKSAFEKALKNFNLAPLVESHKAHILQTYFGGDGVRYSNAVSVLWDEHLTKTQSEQVNAAAGELSAIKKAGGDEKELKKAEKTIKDNSAGLEPLSELYKSLASGEESEEEEPSFGDVFSPEIAEQQEPGEDVGVPGDGKVEENLDGQNVAAEAPKPGVAPKRGRK